MREEINIWYRLENKINQLCAGHLMPGEVIKYRSKHKAYGFCGKIDGCPYFINLAASLSEIIQFIWPHLDSNERIAIMAEVLGQKEIRL